VPNRSSLLGTHAGFFSQVLRCPVLFKLALLLSIIAFGWYLLVRQKLDSAPPQGLIDGLIFDSLTHGYAQTNERHRPIFETADGGKTWNKLIGGATGFRTGRSFANASNGWSIDEDIWDHAKIFQTKNGGNSWTIVFQTGDDGNFVFGGIQAISENTVWSVGGSGAYRTTDSGNHWERRGPPGTALQFQDPERGWIEGDKFWRTTDGGKSWNPIEKDGKTCFGGLGFYFLNERLGWAVSGETEGNVEGGARTGLIWVTKDGGYNCEELAPVPGQILWSVFFLNDQDGWVGGIGTIFQTRNGGHTWARVSGKDR
jgi:photosystem II stability/assembly factor-like uncharacterized protein